MCIGIINLFLCASVDIYFSNVKFLEVIFPVFQDTRQRNIERDENTQDEDICYSKGKVEQWTILMFCMHQKNVYDYCYDYHIHFNINIHIAVICHYDMYQIILYIIHINYITFI